MALNGLAKRLFDVLVAAIGLLLLAPFFAWVAWRTRNDSPGPLIYRGSRLGRGGRLFHILKFRTMYETADSYEGPRVTALDDPRVTPFGRWLRSTKLNELPQLWNVLKGEMSLVGPRPEDPQLGQSWPPEALAEILSMRPGMTSPASVIYRDEERLLAARPAVETYFEAILPSKLRLDQLYVRNHNFWLDLDILFWTLLVVLPRWRNGSQAHPFQPGEKALFAGPVSTFMRRQVGWLMIDTLVTLAAMGFSGLIWRSAGPLDIGWGRAFLIAIGFSFLFSLTGWLLGVDRVDWDRAAYSDIVDLLLAAGLATLIAVLLNYLAGSLLPYGLIGMAAGLAFAGYVVVRYRGRLVSELAARWLRLRGEARLARERVLIVGGGQAGQFAAWLISNDRSGSLFRVVGFVDDDLDKLGLRIQGRQVLGRRSDIPRLVQEHDIGLVIFAIHNIDALERKELLEICAATPARLVLMPDILGELHSTDGQEQSGAAAVQPPAFADLERWLADLQRLLDESDLDGARRQVKVLQRRLHDQDGK